MMRGDLGYLICISGLSSCITILVAEIQASRAQWFGRYASQGACGVLRRIEMLDMASRADVNA